MIFVLVLVKVSCCARGVLDGHFFSTRMWQDEQNVQLSEHQAELEKELANRSQMLEDEVRLPRRFATKDPRLAVFLSTHSSA